MRPRSSTSAAVRGSTTDPRRRRAGRGRPGDPAAVRTGHRLVPQRAGCRGRGGGPAGAAPYGLGAGGGAHRPDERAAARLLAAVGGAVRYRVVAEGEGERRGCPPCGRGRVGSLTVAVDFAQEIKDLRATMDSVREVTDLDKLEGPDRRPRGAGRRPRPLGRPRAGAGGHQPPVPRQHRARAGHRHGRRASTTSRPSSRWARRRRDADDDGRGRARARRPAARPSASSRSAPCCHGEYDEREAVVTIRVRRRWRRRRRLRRDADAHVPALGRAPRLPDQGHGHLLRRGGRAEVGDLRGQRAVRVRHTSRSRPAPTAWCGSARSTTRAAARPASPRSRSSRSSSRPTASRSPRTRSRSTSSAPAAPAARASTPPTRRSG